MKREVIIITDGDQVARKAAEIVAKRLGGRCLSLSAGNPTSLTGPEIIQLINTAAHDPVLVLLDDNGDQKLGSGEKALSYIAKHPDIHVLGVIAVASNAGGNAGTTVNYSVTKEGELVDGIVDKEGNKVPGYQLRGDTVEILNHLQIPYIIGTGDTGKMNGADDPAKGCPVTFQAIETLLAKSKKHSGK
jgi:stage V sporulation protein AE